MDTLHVRFSIRLQFYIFYSALVGGTNQNNYTGNYGNQGGMSHGSSQSIISEFSKPIGNVNLPSQVPLSGAMGGPQGFGAAGQFVNPSNIPVPGSALGMHAMGANDQSSGSMHHPSQSQSQRETDMEQLREMIRKKIVQPSKKAGAGPTHLLNPQSQLPNSSHLGQPQMSQPMLNPSQMTHHSQHQASIMHIGQLSQIGMDVNPMGK